MSLKARLVRDIREDGPITVADYMTRCLHDPLDGYYATRPALGADGDFITAPLVSQMFGEMLGAWTHEVWARLGSPPRLRLVELGPGDGALMSDILRVARADAAFDAAIEPWLIEVSQPLRALQREAVPRAAFAESLSDIPADAPCVILGNEFLDCLPIKQFVLREDGWRERRVGADDNERLVFVEQPVIHPKAGPAEVGTVLETSGRVADLAGEVAVTLLRCGGAALLIDYGRGEAGAGDTLQAVRGHVGEDPLANPGLADLTAHVDFPGFMASANSVGVCCAPIETQGDFLRRLGIVERAQALLRASPEKAAVIERQLARLIAPDQMGALFKVAVLTSPHLDPP